MDGVHILDLVGVFVFAISGVLTAIDHDFDVVGAIIVGSVTAVGGGTLRDIMIGETPVAWMTDTNYLWVILTAVLVSYLFKSYITKLRKGMFFFDTIGIGVFTILGLEKALSIGLDVPIAILMGIVSAVFGGILRDILTNRVPLIFRQEIYATACLVGGLVYLSLNLISDITPLNMGISMLTVFVVRYFAVKNNWSLKLNAR
ncbi:MAG: putative membrane protein YeiH [Chitinophagales bacterium]|jgi:uncharacterized membrane protein YeiH